MESDDKDYFYVMGADRKGPVSFEKLKELGVSGKLSQIHKIWCKGMESWTPAEEHADLPPPLDDDGPKELKFDPSDWRKGESQMPKPEKKDRAGVLGRLFAWCIMRMGSLLQTIGALLQIFAAFGALGTVYMWMSGESNEDGGKVILVSLLFAAIGRVLFRIGSACFHPRKATETKVTIADKPQSSRRELLGLMMFALLTTVACKQTPAGAIERVLNRCATLSAKVNKSEMTAGEAAEFLAREMQSIDTRNCPVDFRKVFQEHANAWRTAAPYFTANTPLTSFLEGLAAGASGNFAFMGMSQNNAAAASMAINETYNRLVVIATAHGAKIPVSEVR